MAIVPTELESTTTTTVTPETSVRKRNRNRRRRGRKNNNNKNSGNVSDTSNSTSSSDRSNQRRNAPKKKSKPQLAIMSEAEKAQYVAMDCEMVGVGYRGTKSVAARVTLVDWHHNILLDVFIKPEEPVTDYRTFVSGITAEQLESENAVDLATARAAVLEILEGRVLIGHALKNDLHALAIRHPWQFTRDTAKYDSFMKVRFNDGILWPRKLKELCAEKLQLEIQTPGKPHSAFEDAVAALKLYAHVRTKWEKVMKYKISKTAEIEQSQSTSASSSSSDEDVAAVWPTLIASSA